MKADHKVTGIRETWTFTRVFPFSLVGDFSDAPTSGPMDAKHTAIIWKQAFSSLKGADYFTHVYANGKPLAVGEAREFNVAIEDKHMVYRFLVPLKSSVDAKALNVTVGIWDETFFVDFESVQHRPIELDGAGSHDCTAESFEDRDHPIFSGLLTPRASKISC